MVDLSLREVVTTPPIQNFNEVSLETRLCEDADFGDLRTSVAVGII